MITRRLKSLLEGARTTLAFSNWPLLLLQRLFYRRLPLVLYEWKGRWSLACDPRSNDHYGVKEVLGYGDYDRYILAAIRDGALAYVNIGANIGAFDIAAASLAPRGSSGLSIELNPNTCARLCLNLAMNGLSKVRAINAAIGGRADVVRFSPSKTSVEDSLFSETKANGPVFEVLVLTLEDVINQYSATQNGFDLLKVDCEGAEYEIIAATPDEVLRRFAAVVMELHPPPDGHCVQKLISKMELAGFRQEQTQGSASGAELQFWTRPPTRVPVGADPLAATIPVAAQRIAQIY
jgi:FkbM family methyltransferase